jgi:hypothetical protein
VVFTLSKLHDSDMIDPITEKSRCGCVPDAHARNRSAQIGELRGKLGAARMAGFA